MPDPTDALHRSHSRLMQWLKDDVFPLWLAYGIDPETGRCAEQLKTDGSPDWQAPLRSRVQARQIYSIAKGIELGLAPSAAEEVAEKALDFYIAECFDRGIDHGALYVWTEDPKARDEVRDLYTQAFPMLAGATLYRGTGNKRALELALAVDSFIQREFRAENGGYLERPGQVDGRRRQNPHMHLLEAYLALHQATGDEQYLLRCDEIMTLFDNHFFDAANPAIIEFFDMDWQPYSGKNQAVEPGHALEWAWLLGEYGKARTNSRLEDAHSLAMRAIEQGSHPVSACIINECEPDHSPRNSRQRLWPQTELLKAAVTLTAGEKITFEAGAGLINRTVDSLFANYFDHGPEGAWIDELDEQGRPVAGPSPASTFYHIICAADVLDSFVQGSRR